ncbi:hypothetical protein CR203_23995 [Salipaludibacillus neizhouensis]|uniref:Lipoprotein n=1 Tax=Salipaludibacillus neizhouensis TaxID=885475 RepID=A0A3A9KBX7_9BACI|nr:hypothetical protein [Salipaludibacillus neizhouensis]RKL64855.1 hypothetical protein CR203_23995 [Salipaludibacillus neizhouensis]
MRLFFYIIVSMAILVIAGCSLQTQTTTHFSGEGDNWEVKYTAYEETADYTIRYTGEDSIPENINYSIANISVTGRELSEYGYVESENSGSNIYENNEEINVIIEWHGKSESLNLKQE